VEETIEDKKKTLALMEIHLDFLKNMHIHLSSYLNSNKRFQKLKKK
jgi:hypothetical protein